MLDAYSIDHQIINNADELHLINDVIGKAYSDEKISVALIKPECWDTVSAEQSYGPRARIIDMRYHADIREPMMTRLDMIKMIMSSADDSDIVVSNIGVPSKETYASKDRPLNFYMLGSYTQATPIGLGMALRTSRNVIVIDGDGSLLGSSVMPVVASENPGNMTMICLDNGTFGSTGDQMTNAYTQVDMELMAKACGIGHTAKAWDRKSLKDAMNEKTEGTKFIHAMIRPGNSSSGNIPMSAMEIKKRFMSSVRP
jgi:sulfopyruvate decarboxylase subunit beta